MDGRKKKERDRRLLSIDFKNFKKGQKGNRIFVQEIAKFIAKAVTVYYALQISKTVTIIESLRYFTFSLRSSY